MPNNNKASLPSAYIRHSIPSRLRINIPSKKRDNRFFEVLGNEISGISGVGNVAANSITASVAINFKTEDPSVLRWIENNGYFVLRKNEVNENERSGMTSEEKSRESNGNEMTPVQKIVKPLSEIDNRLKRFTVGELDAASVAVISLISTGVFQIIRQSFALPSWYTAFWYALNIYVLASRRS